jgi:hypothetical protein
MGAQGQAVAPDIEQEEAENMRDLVIVGQEVRRPQVVGHAQHACVQGGAKHRGMYGITADRAK